MKHTRRILSFILAAALAVPSPVSSYAGEYEIVEDPVVAAEAEESLVDAADTAGAEDAAGAGAEDAVIVGAEDTAGAETPEETLPSAPERDPAVLEYYPQLATAQLAASGEEPTGNNVYIVTFRWESTTFEEKVDLSAPYQVDLANLVSTLGIPGEKVTYAYSEDWDDIVTIQYDDDDRAFAEVSAGFSDEKSLFIEMDMGLPEFEICVSTEWVMPEPEPETAEPEPEPETKQSESETKQSETEQGQSETEAPKPAKVSYLNENGISYLCSAYSTLSEVEGSELTNGWYVLDRDVTINDTLSISGTVNLILCEGYTLSLKGLDVEKTGSLTLYGQKTGAGSLAIDGSMSVSGSARLVLSDALAMTAKRLEVEPSGTLTQYSPGEGTGSLTLASGAESAGRIQLLGGTLHVEQGSIRSSGTLSVSGGVLSGGESELVYSTGIVDISGGTLTGSNVSGSSAIVMIEGTCKLSGGSIEDGFAYGVSVSDGVFTMTDGTISGQSRNGIRVLGGNALMKGGTVSGNGLYGVLVSAQSSRQTAGGTFTMTGGEVTDNTAAGISVEAKGTLEMGGLVTVWGNGIGTNKASDVLLADGKVINIISKFDLASRIGIRCNGTRTVLPFTKNYNKFNIQSYVTNVFSSNEEERHVYTSLQDGEAVLMDNRAVHYIDAEGKIAWCGYFVYARSYNNKNYTWGTDWYVVDRDEKFDGKRLDIVGDVNIILCDGATLTCTDGIYVKKNASLTIWRQNRGTGKLLAYCDGDKGGSWAGIGGNGGDDYGHGDITIYGGIIEARGGNNSAGIGCGPDGKGTGVIRIYGGTITAKGGSHGAGIGGGKNRGNRPIYIYGGNITARGGEYGAGIGGGARGSQDNPIYIYGGTVKAYGGNDAAGIGGGEEKNGGGDGGSVYILGGDVYAESDDNGAGIGGGEDGKGGAFHYYGGRVEAKCEKASIGKGDGGSSQGSIDFHADAKVTFTDGAGTWRLAQTAERVGACRMSHCLIEPCDHPDRTYSDITRHTHTYACPYCGKSETVEHTYDRTTGLCDCGFQLTTITDPSLRLTVGGQVTYPDPKAYKVTTDTAGTQEAEKGNPDRYYYAAAGDTIYYWITPPERVEINSISFWYYTTADLNHKAEADAALLHTNPTTGQKLYRVTVPQTATLNVRAEAVRAARTIEVTEYNPARGSVELSARSVNPGDTVTITVRVAENYIWEGLSRIADSPYTEKQSGDTYVYTFTMPDHDVTITPYFTNMWERLQDYIDSQAKQGASSCYGELTADAIADATNSALVVPAGLHVTLNLKGHTIDRAINRSSNTGGVFIVNGSLTITGSGTITGGRAFNGGAFLVQKGGELTLDSWQVNVTGNSATLGGAIFVMSGGTANLKNAVLTDNSATQGGAVYNDGGTLSITTCTIEQNTASGYGGGIFQRAGTLNLNATARPAIRSNTAGSYGDDLLLGRGQKIHVLGGYFTDNLIIGVSALSLYDGREGSVVITDGFRNISSDSPATIAFESQSPGYELTRDDAYEAVLAKFAPLTLYADNAGETVYKEVAHIVQGSDLSGYSLEQEAPAAEEGCTFAGWTTFPKEDGLYTGEGDLPDLLYRTKADFARLTMPAEGLDLYPVLVSQKAEARFADVDAVQTIYYRGALTLPETTDHAPAHQHVKQWTGPDGELYAPGADFTLSDWSLVQGTGEEAYIAFTPAYEDDPHYTVTFDAAGGSEVASVTVWQGEHVDAPGDPVREGYTFAGWKAEGTEVTFPIRNIQRDLTLTAQWNLIGLNRVTIEGDPVTGATLQAVIEPENAGNITYQWSRGKQTPTGTLGDQYTYTEVEGATEPTYFVTLDDYSTYYYLGPNGCLVVEAIQTLDDGTQIVKTARTDFVQKKSRERVTVRLELDADDAELDAAQPRSFRTGMNATLDLSVMNTATRPGYTLRGWYTTGGMRWEDSTVTAPEYCDSSTPVSTTEDKVPCDDYTLTLTARWETATVEVVYGGETNQDYVQLGKTVTLMDAIFFDGTPEGQRLKYWKDAKGTLHAPGEEMLFDDWTLASYDSSREEYILYLTPVFEAIPDYTVTFDSAGGTYVASVTVREGGSVEEEPKAPTRTGYEFAGWYRDGSKEKESFPIADVRSDLTLTARWSICSYPVTWLANGGSFPSDEGGEKVEKIERTLAYGAAVQAPQTPERAHYAFADWVPKQPAVMPAYALTLEASWTPVSYRLFFDADGGSFADAEYEKEGRSREGETLLLTGLYGAPVTAPADPVREGYTFTGWDRAIPAYMPDTCAASAVEEAAARAAATITARWKKNQEKPEPPTVTAKTDTTITIAVVAGQEYSIDGGKTWIPADGAADPETGAQAGEYVFTGLTPVTDYAILTRRPGSDTLMPSEASEATHATTDRSTREAPEAPAVYASANAVAVYPVTAGQEYRIVKGTESSAWTVPDADGKVVFPGLDEDTEYLVYARWAETDYTYASPASEAATAHTSKVLLERVVIADTEGGTAPYGQALQAVTTPEEDALKDITWQWYRLRTGSEDTASETASIGEPIAGAERALYMPTAEDVGAVLTVQVHQAVQYGEDITKTASVRVEKAAGEDAVDVKTVTDQTSITVTAPVQGDTDTVYEYRLENGEWRTEPVFTGLTPGTVYAVYARSKETDTRYAGDEGRGLARTVPVTTVVKEVVQNADGSWDELEVQVTTPGGTAFAWGYPIKSAEPDELAYYHLAGWNTDGNAASMEAITPWAYFSFDPNTEVIYLYYARNTYDLTFYGDIAGTQVKARYAVRWGAPLAPWFTKTDAEADGEDLYQQVALEGHTFAGWSEHAKEDGSYTWKAAVRDSEEYCLAEGLAQTLMPGEDRTLYPVLIPNRVQIVLDKGAEDAVLDAAQETVFMTDPGVVPGLAYIDAATRPGYRLDGWYTGGGTRWDTAWKVLSDYCDRDGSGALLLKEHESDPYAYYTLTLTARWMLRDVTAVFGDNTDTQQVHLGESIVLPMQADTVPTGRRLKLWEAPNGDTVEPGASFLFSDWSLAEEDEDGTSTLHFTPVFEEIPSYTVRFDSCGGSYVERVQVPENGYAAQPQQPVRTGHTFTGWTLDGAAVTFPLGPVTKDLTLTAGWLANTYKATWDANGGRFAAQGETTLEENVTYGAVLTIPADPERPHYTFAGWTPAVPAAMPAEDLTFRAVWVPVRYEILFDAAGGTFPHWDGEDADGFNPARSTYTLSDSYGAPVTAPADPERDGYVFAGWTNAQYEAVPAYMPDAAPGSDSGRPDAAPLTFTALWRHAVPAKPEIAAEKTTASSVTVTAVPGQEYSIDGGKTWVPAAANADAPDAQTVELVFDDLSPATEYAVITRIPESADALASDASEAAVQKTDRAQQEAPEVPRVVSYLDELEVSPVTDGLEYSIDGGKTWQSPDEEGRVLFIQLKEDTEYEVIARRAETDWQYASPASAPTKARTEKRQDDPTDEEAPEVTAEVTQTRITVTAPVAEQSGDTAFEYSLDGKTWQSAPVFDGLTPSAVYTVYARRAAGDGQEAGPAGKTYVRMLKKVTDIYEVVQNADGSWRAPEAASAQTTADSWFVFPWPVHAEPAGTMEQFYPVGWNTSFDAEAVTPVNALDRIPFASSAEAVYLYYARKTYRLTFWQDIAGQRVRTQYTVLYGASLAPWQDEDAKTDGYTFAGWSCTPKTDGSYHYKAAVKGSEIYCLEELGSMTMPGADLDLYPVLIPHRIQVHLDPGAIDANATATNYNGWRNEAASSYRDANTKAVLDAGQYRCFTTDLTEPLVMDKMNAATRPGYVLDSWYTAGGLKWEADWGTSPVYCDEGADGTPVLREHAVYPYAYYTMTLTARWTPVEITAVFGTGEDASTQTTALGRSLTLPETAESGTEGKRLVRWTDKNGNAYAPGQEFRFTDWLLTEEAEGASGQTAAILRFTPVFEDAPGQILTHAEMDQILPQIEVTGWDAAFAEQLASAEDLKRVKAGENLHFYLVIRAVDKADIPEDEEQVVKTLQSWKGKTADAAQYMDISVYKQIGGDARMQLTDLDGEMLSFKLTVPEDLRDANGLQRTFCIVRVHDGHGAVLVSDTATTLAFASDLFSTYALGYVDEEAQNPSGGGNDTPSTPSSGGGSVTPSDSSGSGNADSSKSSNKKKKKSTGSSGTSAREDAEDEGSSGSLTASGNTAARTGDETPLLPWALQMAAAVLAALLLLRRRRRRKNA